MEEKKVGIYKLVAVVGKNLYKTTVLPLDPNHKFSVQLILSDYRDSSI